MRPRAPAPSELAPSFDLIYSFVCEAPHLNVFDSVHSPKSQIHPPVGLIRPIPTGPVLADETPVSFLYTGVNGSNLNASAVFVPQGPQEVWVGPLADGEAALMLVNKAESLETVAAPFALAGGRFGSGGGGGGGGGGGAAGCSNVSIYDVFGQRSLGFWNGTEMRLRISPHSAEIIRIACVS